MAADLKTMCFQRKTKDFFGEWLKRNNLSTFMSVIKLCFKISNECAYDAYSIGVFWQKNERNIPSAYSFNKKTT